MTKRRRIAFVVQRYGLEITGGSETHCREIAERMSPHYDVEVLTTCASDHLSWKNVFPAGSSLVNGIAVRRFPVQEERKLKQFHEIYDRIFDTQLEAAEENELLRLQGPYCPALVTYLKQNQANYDAFIFFTYMYYTTVHGLPVVKHKAIFVPTAHDEASLYLHILDPFFRQTPRIMFNTDEERFMLQRRFNLPSAWGRVVGMGIDPPSAGKPDSAWDKLKDQIGGRRLMTYVGRVENGKGCDELVNHFVQYVWETKQTDIALLLLGKRTMTLPPHAQIISPGFVSEHVKYQALAHTDIAVAPSPFESLCIAALESWMHRRPLLVNGKCPVLVGHCVRSNGGLWYSSYADFRECTNFLLNDDSVRQRLGGQGREYVESTYRWPIVEQIYRDELEKLFASQAQG